jgi:uncharacterized membrane protein YvlD (DUF360 family)
MSKIIAKWLLNGAVVAPLLMWFTGVPLFTAVVAASVLTFIAYMIGDQFILRMTNNTFAAIMDAVIAAVFLSMVSYMYRWDLSAGETLVIVVILGIVELMYHRYFLREEVQREV